MEKTGEKQVKNTKKTGTGRYENGKATWFKKGQSGNPNGRPKGSVSIRKALYKDLSMEAVDGTTVAEAISKNLIHTAISNKGALGLKACLAILKETDGNLAINININETEKEKRVDEVKNRILLMQENIQ